MTLWCQNFLRPETFARAVDWSLTISYECYPGMHSPATSFPQMQQLEFWANLCWFPLILATFWATAVEQISNLWVLDSVLNFTGRKANGCMHVCTWFSVEVGARKGLFIAFFSALNPPLQKLLFIMKLCQGSNKNLCRNILLVPASLAGHSSVLTSAAYTPGAASMICDSNWLTKHLGLPSHSGNNFSKVSFYWCTSLRSMMILQKTVSTSCQVKKHMWLFSSTTLRPCFGILEGMCCGLFLKLHSSFHLTGTLPEEGKIKIKAFPFIISFNFSISS